MPENGETSGQDVYLIPIRNCTGRKNTMSKCNGQVSQKINEESKSNSKNAN